MRAENRFVSVPTRRIALGAAVVIVVVAFGGAWVTASCAEAKGSQLVTSQPHPTPAPPGP
jgi:hypothetical protein